MLPSQIVGADRQLVVPQPDTAQRLLKQALAFLDLGSRLPKLGSERLDLASEAAHLRNLAPEVAPLCNLAPEVTHLCNLAPEVTHLCNLAPEIPHLCIQTVDTSGDGTEQCALGLPRVAQAPDA